MDPIFYPSCVVNITLRFEDKLYVRDATTNPSTREVTYSNVPMVLRAGPNAESFIDNRVPKKASVELNGYRTAGTFNLTFDYRELPIDPRTIRSAVCDIYLGTVSADDFATGIDTDRYSVSALRRSVLQTNRNGQDRSRATLIGPVDTWKVDYQNGAAEVHLTGRDLRGLLLDSPLVSPNDTRHSHVLNRIDTNQNVADIVRQLLREHNRLRDMEVICYPDEWPNHHIPSPMGTLHVARHRRGASGQGSSASSGHSNMNYWDLITQYCTLVGAIPTVYGTAIYIRPARSLLSQQQAGIDPEIRTPFADGVRREIDGESFGQRKLIYGRDVNTMHIERKYNGNNKPKIVRCISVVENRERPPTRGARREGRSAQRWTRGRVLEAVWPPRTSREARLEGAKTTQINVSGAEGHEEILNIPVPGITDYQRLLDIAQSFYVQIGQTEIEGNFETKNCTSFGGSNADPDMLRLKPGDPVELLVDGTNLYGSAPIISALNQFAGLPLEECVQQLRQYISDPDLARVIVSTYRGQIMSVLRHFRVNTVKYDWDISSGVTINGTFQNYWTPRQDTNLGRPVHQSITPRRAPPNTRQRTTPQRTGAVLPMGSDTRRRS
jgi:hypothetical protein